MPSTHPASPALPTQNKIKRSSAHKCLVPGTVRNLKASRSPPLD
jgi:hypothetical protein